MTIWHIGTCLVTHTVRDLHHLGSWHHSKDVIISNIQLTNRCFFYVSTNNGLYTVMHYICYCKLLFCKKTINVVVVRNKQWRVIDYVCAGDLKPSQWRWPGEGLAGRVSTGQPAEELLRVLHCSRWVLPVIGFCLAGFIWQSSCDGLYVIFSFW